jgi:recombination protein RecT
MILIEWEKVYEAAKNMSLEQFLEATKNIGKMEELPAVQKFTTYMDKYEKQILPSLLQDSRAQISPAKFVQIVINEVKKSDKLLQAFQANPSSMFASILAGAEIGLVPSELTGEFWLIPRKIDGKMTVCPLIGYKGMVKILLRSGDIETVEAHVVYKGDKFSYSYGTSPKIEHKPKSDAAHTAANITHVYAVAHLKTGKTQFQVMTRDEILAIKNMSRYNNDLYFNDKSNPNRWMEKKCCLIQLSKLLDKDYHGSKAIELDNRLEGGAVLTLAKDDKTYKLIEGANVKPKRFTDIYGTLNALPNNQFE